MMCVCRISIKITYLLTYKKSFFNRRLYTLALLREPAAEVILVANKADDS